MMESAPGPEHDRTVADLVSAADSGEFDNRLARLLQQVSPVVDGAVRRALGAFSRGSSGVAGDEIDDLRSDVTVLLVRKLRALRAAGAADAIQNVAAYAATVASNACYAHLRRKYPNRTRLKNQVRYVMTHDPELALARDESESMSCALAQWRDHKPGLKLVVSPETGAGVDAQKLPLADLIKALLRRANGPVEINEMVTAIAELRGIRDIVVAASVAGDVRSLADQIPDPRTTRPAGDDGGFLRRLWEEVRLLPLRQRTALLLNLRDERGRGVLALFSLTGTASMRQVAAALEMAVEELARLWRDLPMDDRRIAERLGVTRQQVINLRKAARARLARRTAARTAGNTVPVLASTRLR